jgi:hypothetical protein
MLCELCKRSLFPMLAELLAVAVFIYSATSSTTAAMTVAVDTQQQI